MHLFPFGQLPDLQRLPPERLVLLKSLYENANVLLRHFWSSLSQEKFEKAEKLRKPMQDHLEKLMTFQKRETDGPTDVSWCTAEVILHQLRVALAREIVYKTELGKC